MISTDLDQACMALRDGAIIAIPTETVYGLAGNAYNESAIRKIFDLKKRPFYNPLIVHIAAAHDLEKVAISIPVKAYKLADKFWPGPLTLILPKQANIPELVTAGKNTVAIRVPNHPLTLSLLEKLEFPLAAPSANPFGSISPTTAVHVHNYFKNALSIILEGGTCERGVESTIIGFEQEEPILYRYGAIAVEEMEAVVGRIKIFTSNNTNPEAPGMLSQHYAPNTPTYLTNNIEDFINDYPDKKIGVLVFKDRLKHEKIVALEVLSNAGDMQEAARNLYAALHRLDTQKLDIIICEHLPDTGLGKTINDRLERATKKP